MIINDPNGQALVINNQGMANVLAVNETLFHRMIRDGLAFSLGSLQITAAGATDAVFFHLLNGESEHIEIHSIIFGSTVAGFVTIEYGRTYSSGGTALTARNLNASSGITVTTTAYYGNAIVLAGTAVDIKIIRVSADVSIRCIAEDEVLILGANDTLAIRFDPDSGTPVIGYTVELHKEEPWE